jgi:hypothetical protein
MANEIKKNAKRLSNDEMKKLKGGLTAAAARCKTNPCRYFESTAAGWVDGKCEGNSAGACVCNAGTSSIVTSACKLEVIIIGGVSDDSYQIIAGEGFDRF